jgi:hypothetical protein
VRPGGGAALAPLRTFRGATVRERTREVRRSQWPPPLASRATKQTTRKGAPDSDSRSVEREGAQAAARDTVKRGAAAPAPQASLTVSRQPSHSGCGKMRRLRCCAPRLRSPGYDLRRAPRIRPHFASNAIRGGLNQRFLNHVLTLAAPWAAFCFREAAGQAPPP